MPQEDRHDDAVGENRGRPRTRAGEPASRGRFEGQEEADLNEAEAEDGKLRRGRVADVLTRNPDEARRVGTDLGQADE